MADKRAPDTRSKNALRAWIQLTKCAKRIEAHVNRRFAESHGTSLSRFDVLANLARCERHAAGATELSRMLLASQGNITRLLDRMEQDRLVRRRPSPADRRINEVQMTRAGETLFARLARDHEAWTDGMFGNLDNDELKQLITLLGKVRARLAGAPSGATAARARP
ncbi:MAG: MarR family winged helix-turn-helix transcriptional regulator [Gammaproteobacteria bacterium]